MDHIQSTRDCTRCTRRTQEETGMHTKNALKLFLNKLETISGKPYNQRNAYSSGPSAKCGCQEQENSIWEFCSKQNYLYYCHNAAFTFLRPSRVLQSSDIGDIIKEIVGFMDVGHSEERDNVYRENSWDVRVCQAFLSGDVKTLFRALCFGGKTSLLNDLKTPDCRLMIQNWSAISRLLCEWECNTNFSWETSSSYMYLLDIAVEKLDVRCVRMLLDGGAHVPMPSVSKVSHVFLKAFRCPELVDVLLDDKYRGNFSQFSKACLGPLNFAADCSMKHPIATELMWYIERFQDFCDADFITRKVAYYISRCFDIFGLMVLGKLLEATGYIPKSMDDYKAFYPPQCGILRERLMFLLENGYANARSIQDSGSTPLHLAASLCDAEISSILLRYRADAHARDKHGMTSLDICRNQLKLKKFWPTYDILFENSQ